MKKWCQALGLAAPQSPSRIGIDFVTIFNVPYHPVALFTLYWASLVPKDSMKMPHVWRSIARSGLAPRAHRGGFLLN